MTDESTATPGRQAARAILIDDDTRLVSQVFVSTSSTRYGAVVEHIFVARLTRLDESARHGPEVDDPSRGQYEPERVELLGGDLTSIDLRPAALKEFVLANRHELLAAVGSGPGLWLRRP